MDLKPISEMLSALEQYRLAYELHTNVAVMHQSYVTQDGKLMSGWALNSLGFKDTDGKPFVTNCAYEVVRGVPRLLLIHDFIILMLAREFRIRAARWGSWRLLATNYESLELHEV